MGKRAYTAEFIGTYALVFFGSMSATVFTAVLGLSSPASSFIGIALTHGLVLMVMAYAIGEVSGCHINPAITISAVALRRLDRDDGAAYLVAQVVAATLAGWTHVLILPEAGKLTNFGAVAPGIPIGRSDLVAMVVELLITFFLMFSVYAAAFAGKVPVGSSGLLIGMTLTADILIAGPLTGGAANPARALGPAVAAGVYGHLWVYIVGPIIGALSAGFVCRYVFTDKKR